jgi:serine/threonine protein phosphatase PrpC
MGCGAKLADAPLTAVAPASAPPPAPADEPEQPAEASASPAETPSPALSSAEEAAPAPAHGQQAAEQAGGVAPDEPLPQPEPVDDGAAVSQADSAAPADEPATATPEPAPALPPQPLAVGTLIAGRFTVVSLLAADASGQIYSATDAHACSLCGASIVPGDKYCANCGVEISGPALVRLQETLAAPETDAVEVDGRWYGVLPAAAAPPSIPAQAGWRLQVGQASDAGKVRELDEDSVFSLALSGIYESQIETTVGLFIVADGIGGHEGGEVASKLATQTIAQQILQDVIWPILRGETLLEETLSGHIAQAVQTANRLIFELRRERDNDMGTTLTMALVVNGLALIGNVGDSRTYVWGPDGLQQVTEDHSLIAALIAAGQEPAEAIYTHPQRNLITRSLGDRSQVEVDLFRLELEPGFKLILCCDGVWEMIRNQGIEDVMLQEDHPQRAADKIVEWSNNAGGEDNISVVVVAVEQP